MMYDTCRLSIPSTLGRAWPHGLTALIAVLLAVPLAHAGVAQEKQSAPVAQSAASQPAVAPAAQSDSRNEEADQEEDDSMDGPPPIRLEPAILDFGIVEPNATKEGVVKLINTGDKELEVLTVQPGCKCTTIDDISGKKIPVGGFLELKSAMKGQSSPGPKRAEIKVLIDGYSEVIKIPLQNEVSLAVRVSPAYMNAVKGQPQNGRIVVESIDRKPFKICSIGGKKPNLVGFDPEKDEPRSQYLVDWDFARDFPDGAAPRYWIIETDRADCPLVDVFVRHESTLPRPALKLTDYRHTFGRLEQGTAHEFTIDVNDLPTGERVITAASNSSAAKVEFVSAEAEGNITHIKLRVVPNAETVGVQYVPFTIYTSTRQQQTAIFGQWVPKGTTGCFGR
jgi:hypothetical protein